MNSPSTHAPSDGPIYVTPMQPQSTAFGPQAAPSLLPELDIKVYVRLIVQRLWLIILCVVAAAGTAYFVSIYTPPIYQATSTLLIDEARSPSANYQDLLTSERRARTYAQLMPAALEQVAEALGIEPDLLEQYAISVNVSPVRDTQLLNVNVEGTSPELIAAVADTLPQVFIEQVQQLQSERFGDSKTSLEEQLTNLQQQLETTQIGLSELGDSLTTEGEIEASRLRNQQAQLQSSYSNLLQSYEALRLAEVQSTDSIVVVESAEVPRLPIRPRVLVNTLLAAIVGGMIALGLIFLAEYLDDRVRTPGDIASVLAGVPLLGRIGRMRGKEERRIIAIEEPRHPITEAYRGLRTNLQFAAIDSTISTLVLTSPSPAEGKTTLAANLSTVIAQGGKRVVLVDADLRKPKQHTVWGLNRGPGLTDALVGGSDPWSLVRSTNVADLYVLTSGKHAPNPAELLGSERMKKIIASLKQEVDMVVLDAPPLLAVADAAILSADADGTLLIVDSQSTKRAALGRAAEALDWVGARLLGVVLNRQTRNARAYYDDYGYYYADEDDDPQAGEPTPTRQPQPSLRKSTA